MRLFSNQAENGTSGDYQHPGKLLNIYVAGNLGGGTLAVEAQLPDKSGWLPIAGGQLDSPGLHVLNAAPLTVRVRLSGAAAPSLDVWLESDGASTYRRVFKRGE
ncbi:hypothetical protein [Halomonas sp. GD1P12]|uniref:hypothetical protein n=1 Tax=Halomonas sp. GD1P12 TaxID=2982691 RepID=UPI0021E45EB0|nr:hypothetical protein [Halomonas sp. GD1P12]UYF99327.1 hypothetical protein OCT39_13980 [Halomonas sp. GD1P12]